MSHNCVIWLTTYLLSAAPICLNLDPFNNAKKPNAKFRSTF